MANAVNANDRLGEFLRRKREETASGGIDWSAKIADWTASVERLFRLLTDDLLKKFIDERLVEVFTDHVQITEPFVGTYTLPELRLKIGNNDVAFLPKSVSVLGSSGRVDIRGDRDVVTLIREQTPDCSRDEWKVVLQRTPKRITAPLDSDSLQAAFERVML